MADLYIINQQGPELWKINSADPDQVTGGYGLVGSLPALLLGIESAAISVGGDLFAVAEFDDSLYKIDITNPVRAGDGYGRIGALPTAATIPTAYIPAGESIVGSNFNGGMSIKPNGDIYLTGSASHTLPGRSLVGHISYLIKIDPANPSRLTDGYGYLGLLPASARFPTTVDIDPSGLALNSTGDLFVVATRFISAASRSGSFLYKIDPNTPNKTTGGYGLLGGLPPRTDGHPIHVEGLEFDKDDNLFVCSGSDGLYKIDPNDPDNTAGTFGYVGDLPRVLDSPTSLSTQKPASGVIQATSITLGAVQITAAPVAVPDAPASDVATRITLGAVEITTPNITSVDPPPIPRLTNGVYLTIGEPTVDTADITRWEFSPGILVDPDLVVGDATAYLRYLQLLHTPGRGENYEVRLQLADTPTGDSSTAGPELTPEWEGYLNALALRLGAREWQIQGPALSGFWNPPTDFTEPYEWNPRTGTGAHGGGADINEFGSQYPPLTGKENTQLRLWDGSAVVDVTDIASRITLGAVQVTVSLAPNVTEIAPRIVLGAVRVLAQPDAKTSDIASIISAGAVQVTAAPDARISLISPTITTGAVRVEVPTVYFIKSLLNGIYTPIGPPTISTANVQEWRFSPGILIDPELVDGGGEAYLVYLRLFTDSGSVQAGIRLE